VNENPTNARAVASPVFSQAQMVRANWVMPVPRNETSWPNQTTVNPRIPESRLDSDAITINPSLRSVFITWTHVS